MREVYFEQIETYPNDIIGCVRGYSDYLQKYINSKMKKDAFSVRCALSSDSFWSDNIIQQLYKELWNVAQKYFWVGYHVTRICSNNEILQHGLVKLEFENYWNRISKVLRDNGIIESDMCYAMERVRKMYNGFLGERKERVFFFAPRDLLYKGKFDYFAKNYGGEIAERSFENCKGMEMVWDILTRMGTPIIVTFRFKLSDLYSFQNDDVFMEILRFVTSKLFMSYDYPISIGQHIKKSIPPEDILGIEKIKIRE